MLKLLIKVFNAIKHIKIPFRLKSKLHDDFHCTLAQVYKRKLSKLIAQGKNKNEIIENFSGKKISELSEQELKNYGEWVDANILQMNQLDKSFDSVFPSLFSQRYYRRVFDSSSGMCNLQKGDIYTDYGYSWYAPKKSYANDFLDDNSGVIIETIIPRGAKISRDINISFPDGIHGLNPFSSMNVVVQRNINYEVLDRTIKDDKTYLKFKYLGI